MYYLNARYYDPETGRFISADDNLEGGLNLFAYCYNNPIMFTDKDGHESTYVFYYNTAVRGLKNQAIDSYYYSSKSNDVKLIPVVSKKDFIDAWNSMEGEIDEVYIFVHGAEGVLWFKGESMSMDEIKKLNSKSVSNRVGLFSCNGGRGEEGSNVAWAFAKLTGAKVHATSSGISFTRSLGIIGKYEARVGKEDFLKLTSGWNTYYYENSEAKVSKTQKKWAYT